MAEIRIAVSTLFGVEDADAPHSPGEAFVGREILASWNEMCSRADWCMDHLPYTGNLLLDEEDGILLKECFSAYVLGMYAAAIISSDAFLERIITDSVETAGHEVGRQGFGRTLESFAELRLVDTAVFERIVRLHKIRNNFAHERGPSHELRLSRRALSGRRPTAYIIKQDAREAVCLAHGLAGKLLRNFPRTKLPGIDNQVVKRPIFKQ